jgi:predicted transcriptional regulator
VTGAKQQLARFPNLSKYRVELGLSISELSAKIGPVPSEKSIRRLEEGTPIRIASVNKVFNYINTQMGGLLQRPKEVLPVL